MATEVPYRARCAPAAGSAPRTLTSTRSYALRTLVAGEPAPVTYVQDGVTGDYWPEGDAAGWSTADRPAGAACARG